MEGGRRARPPQRVSIHPMLEGPVARDTTAALRERSTAALEDGFRRHVAAASAKHAWDSRDEMLSLTPFIDCARRLGLEPAVVLGPIAADGADWLRTTFDAFVRRADVSLGAFGWSIVETRDGPAYRFAWPAWTPRGNGQG
jgi:hypothetical protein